MPRSKIKDCYIVDILWIADCRKVAVKNKHDNLVVAGC